MNRPSIPAPRITATTSAAAVVIAALIATVGVPATAVAAPPPVIAVLAPIATADTAHAPAGTLTDADLDDLVALLESLPADIQSADPRATPDYEQRLSRALDRAAEEQGLSPASRQATAHTALLLGDASRTVPLTGTTNATPSMTRATDWIACAGSVAGVIAQYGLPVFKVLSWIRETRSLWGGVAGIIHALNRGIAAVEIGGEAAQVLWGLLGIGGVLRNCFGVSAVTA